MIYCYAVAANQQLPARKQRDAEDAQADGMSPPKGAAWRASVGTLSVVCRGFVLSNSVGNVHLYPWVHHVTIQRRSPA